MYLTNRQSLAALFGALALAAASHAPAPALAQLESAPPSLKGTTPPPVTERISGLDLVPHFVVNEQAAIELGKALFWDMQVGSDGQACASCHFHSGVDNRLKNQLSPAFIFGGNNTFDPTGSDGAGGPNYTLVEDDFPFHRLADPNDRNSELLFDTDDVYSSHGVFGSEFNDIIPGLASMFAAYDDCEIAGGGDGDPTGFHVGGTNTRRVEPRHTPSAVNAVLNFRNFWDGRANNIFNGVNPFGRRDPNASVLEVQSDGSVAHIMVEFENASLASQAVGPPLSPFEMSCAGRTFAKLGKKILELKPLGLQEVASTDSVLGSLADAPKGLTTQYEALIEAAFHERFWDSDELFDAAGNPLGMSGVPLTTDQYSMKEINFSLYWGLAIHMYEATLISDDAPYDRGELTDPQKRGLDVFLNDGKCINCHATAMFTKASTLHLIDEAEEEGLVERMSMGHEQHHYSIVGNGKFSNATDHPAVQVTFRAEGTPKADSSTSTIVPGLAPDSAGGSLQVRIKKRRWLTCEYTVDSFTLDPDGDPDTLDAGVTASFESGQRACPKSVAIDAIDNKPVSEKETCDHVTVLDSIVDGETVVSGCVDRGSLRILPPALYDNGFYNISVRPTEEDLSLGADGEFGNPLSFTVQYLDLLRGKDAPDPFQIDECRFEIRFDPIVDAPFYPGGFDEVPCDDGSTAYRPSNNEANKSAIIHTRVAVDGAFKTPTVRNVELTGAFFHNGGDASLEQLVEFYNRGGNFPDNNKPNLDPDIRELGLSAEQRADLVAFMKSLTDDRVRCEKAPFDHPQIWLTNGHEGDESMVTDAGDGTAVDELLELPAVGSDGRSDCPGGNALKPLFE